MVWMQDKSGPYLNYRLVCVIVLKPSLQLENGPEMSQTTDTFPHL